MVRQCDLIVYRGKDGKILCNCKEPAVKLTVRRESINKGKDFYKCNKSSNDVTKCDLFLWSDEIPQSTEVEITAYEGATASKVEGLEDVKGLEGEKEEEANNDLDEESSSKKRGVDEILEDSVEPGSKRRVSRRLQERESTPVLEVVQHQLELVPFSSPTPIQTQSQPQPIAGPSSSQNIPPPSSQSQAYSQSQLLNSPFAANNPIKPEDFSSQPNSPSKSNSLSGDVNVLRFEIRKRDNTITASKKRENNLKQQIEILKLDSKNKDERIALLEEELVEARSYHTSCDSQDS